MILNAAIAVVQTLLPISDPSNQSKLAAFLADTINDQDTLFKTPLEFDIEALEEHLQKQEQEQEEMEEQQKQLTAQGGGAGGPGGGGGGAAENPFGKMKVPKAGKIGGGRMDASWDDKVSHALERLHSSVERLPSKHGGPKAQVRELMDGLAKRSGVRK